MMLVYYMVILLYIHANSYVYTQAVNNNRKYTNIKLTDYIHTLFNNLTLYGSNNISITDKLVQSVVAPVSSNRNNNNNNIRSNYIKQVLINITGIDVLNSSNIFGINLFNATSLLNRFNSKPVNNIDNNKSNTGFNNNIDDTNNNNNVPPTIIVPPSIPTNNAFTDTLYNNILNNPSINTIKPAQVNINNLLGDNNNLP